MAKDELKLNLKVPAGCFTGVGWSLTVILAGIAMFVLKEAWIVGLILVTGWLVANKISGNETIGILDKLNHFLPTRNSQSPQLPDNRGKNRSEDDEDP